MEQQLQIPVRGQKKLYGFVRGNPKTQPLVIFVHGLTSEMNEPKFYQGARWFEQLGIATYRYGQVAWQKDGRKLHECSIAQHAQDLDAVIAYFRRKGSQDITVVGHSMGALIIMSSKKKNFDRVALWDASYHPVTWTKKLPYIKEKKAYLMDNGFGVLISEAMVKERQTVDYEALVAKMKAPTLFIYAEDGPLARGVRAYYKRSAAKDKKLDGIEGAGHNFDEEGATEKLLAVTAGWLLDRV